ncbi:MAG: hypothetical protein WBP29_14090 [Candidatus Zixiibacteriota bacterium]
MLDYNGKVAGIVSRDQSWQYIVAEPKNGSIKIAASGCIDLETAGPESFLPLLGCKCVYGINRSQYHRKQFHLADDLAASDSEQFIWELSHCSVDNIENYHYSLLQLHPGDKGIHIECLSINRKTFDQIGHVFDRHQLTLDKLIFEPEAIRQSVKPLISDDRVMFLHVENDSVCLQMFRRGHLVAMEILRGNSLAADASQLNLAEEIGVLLMSTFGGRTVRTKISLYTSGDQVRAAIAVCLKQTLHYDFTLFDFPFDRLHIDSNGLNNQQLHQYFSPLMLCYAYNRSLKCASLPEKNAVLS